MQNFFSVSKKDKWIPNLLSVQSDLWERMIFGQAEEWEWVQEIGKGNCTVSKNLFYNLESWEFGNPAKFLKMS